MTGNSQGHSFHFKNFSRADKTRVSIETHRALFNPSVSALSLQRVLYCRPFRGPGFFNVCRVIFCEFLYTSRRWRWKVICGCQDGLAVQGYNNSEHTSFSCTAIISCAVPIVLSWNVTIHWNNYIIISTFYSNKWCIKSYLPPLKGECYVFISANVVMTWAVIQVVLRTMIIMLYCQHTNMPRLS